MVLAYTNIPFKRYKVILENRKWHLTNINVQSDRPAVH